MTTVIDITDTVNVQEAAKIKGRHPETIKRLIRQGDIPAREIGLVWFINIADLDALKSSEHV